ncbi:hypothetical protein [Bradyrhizobium brasilense]|uniref:hypothetical protein n=1 Tax=Bradyrhizobium brasilense TaxID=1419277 RepID=UPI000B86684E|nr:hypothetical protein [Bradyrhizobium brasilense]MCC8972345.1 hypothetical protein [Bradyrhizobium brasilense]
MHNEASSISKRSAFIREIVASSAELLKLPAPDTFLGRKAQEPFPQEESGYGEAQDRGYAT